MSLKSNARISTRTSGWRAPNMASSGESSEPGVGPSEPITSALPSPRASARARPSAPSTAARIARPSVSSASPAGVSVTRRVLRTSSGPPSSASRWRIWADRADCARCSRAAAREKCSSSATVTK